GKLWSCRMSRLSARCLTPIGPARVRLRLEAIDNLGVRFVFKNPAITKIYTLSLHDALPISSNCGRPPSESSLCLPRDRRRHSEEDRKSTRLNSSHLVISYAVFCLKKKNPHT